MPNNYPRQEVTRRENSSNAISKPKNLLQGTETMKNVLIVDDSPTELAVVHQAMESSGYVLTTAVSGEEALEKIARVKPDLVVLDIILPGKNGFQVCRDLKKTPATADIKVILLSTKNQESDKFWGEKQGADAYLTKPFDPDELRTLVAELLI